MKFRAAEWAPDLSLVDRFLCLQVVDTKKTHVVPTALALKNVTEIPKTDWTIEPEPSFFIVICQCTLRVKLAGVNFGLDSDVRFELHVILVRS